MFFHFAVTPFTDTFTVHMLTTHLNVITLPPTDTDGSVILRPGNKYEYSFGFELPQQG